MIEDCRSVLHFVQVYFARGEIKDVLRRLSRTLDVFSARGDEVRGQGVPLRYFRPLGPKQWEVLEDTIPLCDVYQGDKFQWRYDSFVRVNDIQLITELQQPLERCAHLIVNYHAMRGLCQLGVYGLYCAEIWDHYGRHYTTNLQGSHSSRNAFAAALALFLLLRTCDVRARLFGCGVGLLCNCGHDDVTKDGGRRQNHIAMNPKLVTIGRAEYQVGP